MRERAFYDYTIYENGEIVNKHGHVMKQRVRKQKGQGARSEIKLTVNGKKKNFTVARLVYCVFNNIDPLELDKDQCVTFKDGDKLNIHIDNLKLVPRADLIHGSKHSAIAKLTEKEVQEIRSKYNSTKGNRPVNQYDKGNKEYHSYRSLAKEYGVTHTLIKQIVEGDTRNKNKYKL